MSGATYAHLHAPVGGRILTPGYRVLLALVGIGAAAMLARFLFGLGAVTNLNNGYPWGIWISFDVVTGTALGCGGYAVALLVYVLNKGQYHPLVRPAVLTSLLGYGLAVLAVTVDLGRYWSLWKVPVFFWRWTHSPQLEVALCVAAYVLVLLVELSPAVFEKWQTSQSPALRSRAATGLRLVNKSLVWLLALGLLLPTMHQSSLGTMMLLPATKLHALWFTPWLPLLFLVSALLMGYAVVVVEASYASAAFGRPRETAMLASLARVVMWVAVFFGAFRLVEVLVAGDVRWLGSLLGVVFIIETGLHLAGAYLLRNEAGRSSPRTQVQAALLLLAGGMMFRIDTYWTAFSPGPQFRYFPAVPELFITIGIVALEIALYLAAVKVFPILSSGHHPVTGDR